MSRVLGAFFVTRYFSLFQPPHLEKRQRIVGSALAQKEEGSGALLHTLGTLLEIQDKEPLFHWLQDQNSWGQRYKTVSRAFSLHSADLDSFNPQHPIWSPVYHQE